MKKIALTLMLGLALVGCSGGSSAPAPDSDSSSSYDGGSIPTDDQVYDITGKVVGDVTSGTHQVSPGKITIDTPTCYGTSGCYGGGGGTVFGPISAGKGFVRLSVQKAFPVSKDAPEGATILIKTSDTKAAALLVGDIVKFRCRHQYEAVAAIRDNEKFRSGAVATWEFDFCRLASPIISKP